MRTAYDILISLTVTHSFFSDKVFDTFELRSDNNTGKLIKQLKLVTKKTGNTWNMFFQTEGPFSGSMASFINKEFWFSFKITDTSFYGITDESYLPGKSEMLYFNSPINSVMVPEKRKVYPLKLAYKIHHEAVRPVSIKVTTAKGVQLYSYLVIDPVQDKQDMDLTTNGQGIYNIAEDTVPAGNLEQEKIFAKETEDNEPLYGMVYFKILPIEDNVLSNQYQIKFQPKN